jgi:6-phosphogluconate dehydrogenase (decarboxylating)
MKYAVIGLGEFGSSAAVGLFRKGAEVIAVDVDMDRVNKVKDEVSLAVRRIEFGGHSAGPRYLFVRAPLQLTLILWTYWFVLRGGS